MMTFLRQPQEPRARSIPKSRWQHKAGFTREDEEREEESDVTNQDEQSEDESSQYEQYNSAKAKLMGSTPNRCCCLMHFQLKYRIYATC
jgi:hypothetical protein